MEGGACYIVARENKLMRWLCILLAACPLFAESGAPAWLRYAPVDETAARSVPAVLTVVGDSAVIGSARAELVRGVRGMLGRALRLEAGLPTESAILACTLKDLPTFAPQVKLDGTLAPDAFWLKTVHVGPTRYLVIAGGNDRGVLYGSFALLRKIATGEPIAELDEKQTPYAPVRWVNQWDNLDGTIERGYGGRSIFWDGGRVRDDMTRVGEYGRLLASIGINGCSINNVNADRRVISPDYLPQVAKIAAALRPWGVRVAVSIDFASPQSLGKLNTFDPLDPQVIAWWKDTADQLYGAVPDLGGIVIKADSEGRVGPSAYNRTHADAANVVARALAPHGGLIFYRGFVYDHHMDWRNLKLDRARAADDNFRALDGKFDDNAIVQIKHGPIDFQVREPASPLFGTLEKTNQAIELQVTQEYFGQAKYLVYLVPYWKEALDFDLHAGASATPVKALAAGKVFHRPAGGFVGVANVGLDENWAGNHHSMANLYGFGRLAWDPDLSAKRILDEWTKMTFGSDAKVMETIESINLASWRAFENYTGPLGLQTLTDIVGNHYGVAVEASEGNGWGQWHRADEKGAGMDRTVATGTGYAGQYRPAVAKMYESPATCPDELLLFFHHVPYTHQLHSGKTVIQSLYDAHYDGAAAVEDWVRQWKSLAGRVDERRYHEVLAQLQYQAGQAIVWRDAVNNWFHRASGIADAKGRVGNHPGRIEAEAMQLEGYTVRDITPWEGASGGKAVACAAASCAVTWRYDGAAAWHNITVQYFDQMTGASRFRLLVGAQVIDEWIADQHGVPARRMDSSASTRRTIAGVALRQGDIIRIEGTPDGGEAAGIDYIEIH
jgi:alpha-glucuronidase